MTLQRDTDWLDVPKQIISKKWTKHSQGQSIRLITIQTTDTPMLIKKVSDFPNI